MTTPRRATPVLREFLADSLTPLGVYQRLQEDSTYSFLFESVTGGEQVSRYSLMGADPAELLLVYPDRLEVVDLEGGGGRERLPGEPLDTLKRRVASVASEPQPLPFTGGWVGFFGWDLIRLLERLPNQPPNPFDLPVVMLARYDDVIVFDHARQRVVVLANAIDGVRSSQEAEERIERIGARLTGDVEAAGVVSMPPALPPAATTGPPTLSDEEYGRGVERIKEYIGAGDIFQAVLARRWEVEGDVEPMALYRALRMVDPSPYMVLLESPDVSLVGASPEMLVRQTGGRLETRPIAGTRPRGGSVEEDRRLAAEMLADPKERAEHVMLVDLGRNDLGRVAAPGSVWVDSFMQVEYYARVMHIVSSVAAQPAEGSSALDTLFACFPAGTLSGAPKIRAMEILDELEPEARGPYGGAIGYLSFSGDLDTCITIRTLVVEPGRSSVTAGAGIVADSDPVREAQETRDKAAAMLQAIGLAAELSTTSPKGRTSGAAAGQGGAR